MAEERCQLPLQLCMELSGHGLGPWWRGHALLSPAVPDLLRLLNGAQTIEGQL